MDGKTGATREELLLTAVLLVAALAAVFGL